MQKSALSSGWRPLLGSVALTFPLCVGVDASSVLLDTVVVTGARVEHSSFDLPAAIDVVDRERIDADRGRVNASEALAAVPGINVLNRQNYAQDLQISSRGFGARSAFGVRGIRLISDGIPASMPDGQGQAATFNLDQAGRIEVMRGPMSAVYGNHSGGVIQMFTPDGSGAPIIEGNISGGSYGTWKADVASRGELGGVGYVIDASRFASDGYRDHSSVTRDQQMAKLTFAPDAHSKVTLIANNFRQPDAQDPLGLTWAGYRADPRSVEAAALEFNTRKSIEHTQGGATYERRFGSDLIQLSAYTGTRSVTQYQSIPLSAQRFIAATAANSSRRRHSGGVIDFDREFGGLSGRWILRGEVAGGKWTATVGVDYETSTDDRKGYENFLTTSAALNITCGVGGTVCGVRGNLRRDEKNTVTSTDPYLQGEWQYDRWLLSAGVRQSNIRVKVEDNYITTGNPDDSGKVHFTHTTPTVAAAYKISPTVNAYVSAARGFEAPTLNELAYSSASGSFSFDLKPATSTHVEAGLKAFLGSDTRLDLALFDIKVDDELVVFKNSGGRSSYQNAGKTRRRGWELAVDSLWSHGLSTRLAYTDLRATYEQDFLECQGTPCATPTVLVESGNRLPGIPRRSLFGEVAWHHAASGFHTALEVIARDKMYVEDTNTQKAAPGYLVANLRFGIDQHRGPWLLKGFLRFENIFDRGYVGSVIVSDGNQRFYESAPGANWLAGASATYRF